MAEFQYLNGLNSEVQDKQAEAYLYESSGTTGIAASGVIEGLVVRQTSTASGSVLIDAGACLNQASLGQGADRLINPSQKTLDIFTANPVGSLPRNDVIEFDSVTTLISVRVGTPNATPTDPTVSATSVALARLRHLSPGGIGATTIPTAQIDQRQVPITLRGASGAMGTPTSTTSQGTPTAGGAVEIRDAILGNYAFTAIAGRRYEVKVGGQGANTTVADDAATLNVRNGGASTPTTASPIVASGKVVLPSGSSGITVPMAGSTFTPSAGVQTLSLFTVRNAGSGVITPTMAGSMAKRELYVVDLGPA